MKNISFGQYYPAESIIHRLDPRTKVILAILYIVCSFVCQSAIGFTALIFSMLAIILISKIPIKTILRSIKPVIIIMVFMAFLNLFLVKGGVELTVWKITIYSKGIYTAVTSVLRVISLIIGTGIFLTYTTTPIELTDGIEQLFGFLKKIKIPVHEFAMMMTIALRFIPTLMEETDKIISAQKARGADFTNGSIVKRAKALIPILVPLFISAFRRADELAIAMECRCYRGGEGRTKLHVLRYRTRDFISMFIFIAFLAGLILINCFGVEYPFIENGWF
ncbi:MAG: energy-coupling factor transporter transmembrane protein EcfT [Clostridia bacterium]|nr:energy-coupling factor transporter transmembrane protein EcfT [Clostridia bacterium]